MTVLVTPCSVESEPEPCKLLAEDEQAAEDVYTVLEITEHSIDSFAADVLLGNFEKLVTISGTQVTLSPGNIRHKTRCWKCSKGAPEAKAKKWCQHPLHLWIGRKNTPDIFKIAEQILGIHESRSELLDVIPDRFKELIKRRLDHMVDVARLAMTMKDDHWLADYTDALCKHLIGLRHKRVSVQLPLQLIEQSSCSLIDEKDKPWGRLRGKGSIVVKVAEYMEEQGTDHMFIYEWTSGVSGKSWSQQGQVMRVFWARQRVQSVVKATSYWWQEAKFKDKRSIVVKIKEAIGQYDYVVRTHKREAHKCAWQIWHAFHQEIFAKVDFRRNDRGAKTIKLLRTELKKGLTANDITTYGTGLSMKRSVWASASLFAPVSAEGDEFTIQDVPHHRIVACYFMSRMPEGTNCAFKQDEESEFIFMTQGIEFDYVESLPLDW